ncbi:MAG: hypothetical protein NVSMB49_19320 [Ktedonobacteraceae bacterium]
MSVHMRLHNDIPVPSVASVAEDDTLSRSYLADHQTPVDSGPANVLSQAVLWLRRTQQPRSAFARLVRRNTMQ